MSAIRTKRIEAGVYTVAVGDRVVELHRSRPGKPAKAGDPWHVVDLTLERGRQLVAERWTKGDAVVAAVAYLEGQS